MNKNIFLIFGLKILKINKRAYTVISRPLVSGAHMSGAQSAALKSWAQGERRSYFNSWAQKERRSFFIARAHDER